MRDVVICGAGLSGLLLARQIRRELPDRSVTLLERIRRPLPDACHKVGESSVELGAQYLERLGLRDYLLDRHLVKLGLRFFPGGGELPLAERTELGPCAEPLVRSYQIDRGRFENDLRGFDEADGVELIEGAKVTDIRLGHDGEEHVVGFTIDGQERRLRTRWVVDATGRSALLRRRMKLTRNARHEASAGWFRVRGRLDLNDLVPRDNGEWHRRPCSELRWRSTNHFMGRGYWAWLIPLSTGSHSVGLVIHREIHDANCIAGLDRVMDFLRQHEPHLAAMLENADVQDFLCLNNYSHMVSRAWSEDRWALVGEAGAFVDPLYSPGTDYIALANSFTVEMLRAERDGGDLRSKASNLTALYRALVAGAIALFRDAGPVYGHPRAMAAKVYFDNFAYWSFTCQCFQQDLYRLPPDEYAPYGRIGRRFLELSAHVQALLRRWAEVTPAVQEPVFRGAPTFPSILVEAHAAVGQRMPPAEVLPYLEMRLTQAEEMVSELVLRVVQEVGGEKARELLQHVRFAKWEVTVPPERLVVEGLDSLARHKRLSVVARDMERTLGPVHRPADAAAARELLAQPGVVS